MVPTADKVFYFYSKDTSVIEKDGKLVKNPLRAKKRQRRQVIAGVLLDNHLYFGKSECSHEDVFIKTVGRDKARGRALSVDTEKRKSQCLKKFEVKDASNIGHIFVSLAKEMLTVPGKKKKSVVTY